jgi:hypothetical protein
MKAFFRRYVVGVKQFDTPADHPNSIISTHNITKCIKCRLIKINQLEMDVKCKFTFLFLIF